MAGETGGGVRREMPRYRCHKVVWALRIAGVGESTADGTAQLTFAEPGFAPLVVSADYVRKHLAGLAPEGVIGGYYVVYADGYASFSPAKAFEEGYTPLRAPAAAPKAPLPDDVKAALLLAQDALRWCSGSADFNDGGQARVGWLAPGGPRDALDAIDTVLR